MIIVQNRKKQEVVVSTTDLSYANLTGAILDYANLTYANLTGANLTGASLTGANLTGAVLDYANLTGASLTGANLTGASLTGADLNEVSIENTIFLSADLAYVKNLPERINTKEKFIAECGAENVNAETIWIDGTSILD